MAITDLPAVNACLNGVSAAFLAVGRFFISRKQVSAHRKCMVTAFIASICFLASYITYHTYLGVVLHQGPTRFLKPGWFRPIYLTILATHTLLAVVIVPLVLTTLTLALKHRFDAHRKVARWTWPLWMYVSVTGVLIYFLLYQIFPQR